MTDPTFIANAALAAFIGIVGIWFGRDLKKWSDDPWVDFFKLIVVFGLAVLLSLTPGLTVMKLINHDTGVAMIKYLGKFVGFRFIWITIVTFIVMIFTREGEHQ